MRVRDIMSTRVVTVTPATPVHRVTELLADGGFTAIPVVDEHGAVVGMVSEVDVLASRFPQDLRYWHLPPAEPHATAGEVMAEPAVTVDAGVDVGELVELMWQHRHRCLPVVRDGQLVGIVTRRDLTRVLAREDADVADEVRSRLAALGDPDRWRVAVVDGRVDIDDHGGDESGRRAAIALAETVRGVTEVLVTGPTGRT